MSHLAIPQNPFAPEGDRFVSVPDSEEGKQAVPLQAIANQYAQDASILQRTNALRAAILENRLPDATNLLEQGPVFYNREIGLLVGGIGDANFATDFLNKSNATLEQRMEVQEVLALSLAGGSVNASDDGCCIIL